jgi:phosphoribosylformylglycinamidine synthase
VRNLVCVGTAPSRIAILDNFCWPSCTKPENLGALVRAAEGCYDGAKAYRTPFVSGKDSLNNQFTIGKPPNARTIEIPPTLLITGIGIVEDISKCLTMDAKASGNVLVLVGATAKDMGGSHYRQVFGAGGAEAVPRTDLRLCPSIARAVHEAIRDGLVVSAHDCSDGGLLCAVAEMLIAGSVEGAPIGASIDLAAAHADPVVAAFSETPGRYVLEVEQRHYAALRRVLSNVPHVAIGALDDSGELRVLGAGRQQVEELRRAWTGTLDW